MMRESSAPDSQSDPELEDEGVSLRGTSVVAMIIVASMISAIVWGGTIATANEPRPGSTAGPIAATTTPEVPVVTVTNASGTVGETVRVSVRLDRVPAGLSGYLITVSLRNSDVATILNASYPDSFGLTTSPVVDTGTTVRLKAADIENATTPGTTHVKLATIKLKLVAVGQAAVTVTVDQMDDDMGGKMTPQTRAGIITVERETTPTANETASKTTPTDGSETTTTEPRNGDTTSQRDTNEGVLSRVSRTVRTIVRDLGGARTVHRAIEGITDIVQNLLNKVF